MCAAGGSLLACEMVVLGRAASGERFTSGLLLDAWSVRRAGKLAWTDTLRVEGETPAGAGFGAANALATVIGVWDEPHAPVRAGPALLEDAGEVRAGVTLVNGVMVARLLGEATAVRASATAFLTAFAAGACHGFGISEVKRVIAVISGGQGSLGFLNAWCSTHRESAGGSGRSDTAGDGNG